MTASQSVCALLAWLQARAANGTVVKTVGQVIDGARSGDLTPPPADSDGPTPPPADPGAPTPPPADPGDATPPLGGPATPPVRELAATRAAGSAALSDAEAASHVRRSPWEPRPANYGANHRVPTSSELAGFYAYDRDFSPCERHHHRVTGDFTGTTDEIIQWAAWKWGIDEDVVRAVAAQESYWRHSGVGDNGHSYGLMQVKRPTGEPYFGWGSTYALSQQSTAFNVDFWAMTIRYYYDGCAAWLQAYDNDYAAADLWGSIGSWYSGRWHDSAAEWYISQVKAVLSERTWEQPGF